MLKILFIIIACVSMLFLLYINISIIGTFFITLLVLLICNYTAGYIISTLRRKVIDSDCDPERFLIMIDKQEKRRGKEKRVVNRLDINRAAAHLLLGNIQTAKGYLDEIDATYLSEKDGSFLAYTINLILCHYELGEIEKAERLYETNLIKLCPLGKRLKKSVEILIGERYYYLGKYDLSYEHLNKLLNFDLDKRQYLGILFRLAQMDIMKGETDQAMKRLNKIVKFGNKLWIVKASQEIMQGIN